MAFDPAVPFDGLPALPPGADTETAAEYLRALEESGVLASEMVGRERIFVNLALLNLLKEGQS